MPIYRIVRKADQVEVYRYEEQAPIEWAGFEFATHDHIEVPSEPAPTPPASPRRISKLAFRQRFSQAEKVAIEIAALDVPTVTMQARAQAAALRASQADVLAATFIDLDRTDTRAGVIVLEQASLLAPGRALEILDAQIQEHEVWHG